MGSWGQRVGGGGEAQALPTYLIRVVVVVLVGQQVVRVAVLVVGVVPVVVVPGARALLQQPPTAVDVGGLLSRVHRVAGLGAGVGALGSRAPLGRRAPLVGGRHRGRVGHTAQTAAPPAVIRVHGALDVLPPRGVTVAGTRRGRDGAGGAAVRQQQAPGLGVGHGRRDGHKHHLGVDDAPQGLLHDVVGQGVGGRVQQQHGGPNLEQPQARSAGQGGHGSTPARHRYGCNPQPPWAGGGGTRSPRSVACAPPQGTPVAGRREHG